MKEYIIQKFDPVCSLHGMRWSDHEFGRCMYCCLCFKTMELSNMNEFYRDNNGHYHDICLECKRMEDES